jgi:Fibronectin type III domain
MKTLAVYVLSMLFGFCTSGILNGQQRPPIITISKDSTFSNGFIAILIPQQNAAVRELQVARDSLFSSVVKTIQIRREVCELNKMLVRELESGKTYYVRGRTAVVELEDLKIPGGTIPQWSPFSTTLTITLPVQSLPSIPILAQTKNISNEKFAITWQSSLGEPEFYDVQLSLDSTFTQIFKGTSVKDTLVIFSGLSPNMRYFYRVRARNNSGISRVCKKFCVNVRETLVIVREKG